jgi:hypothetical protein
VWLLFKLPNPIWTVGIPPFARLLHDGVALFVAVRIGLDEKTAISLFNDFYLCRLLGHTDELCGADRVPAALRMIQTSAGLCHDVVFVLAITTWSIGFGVVGHVSGEELHLATLLAHPVGAPFVERS